MYRVSLLSYLTQPNPVLDTTRLRPGGVTKTTVPLDITSSYIWDEFNYNALVAKFRRVLVSKHRLHPICEISGYGRAVFNEDTLEHQILSRDTIPPVNEALNAAAQWAGTKYGKQFPVSQICRGGICIYETGNKARPDWALTQGHNRDSRGYFFNCMPGDTKLSTKWTSTIGLREHGDEYYTQGGPLLPLEQVARYCDGSRTRYGFLLSDQELVVIEFRKDPIEAGIAVTRARRPVVQHTRIPSANSLDSSMSGLSVSSGKSTAQSWGTSGGTYEPDSIGDPIHVRYASIPWNAQGDKQLTVRLSLFCLALMASYGETWMSPDFSDIESWSLRTYHKRLKAGARRAEHHEKSLEDILDDHESGEEDFNAGVPSDTDSDLDSYDYDNDASANTD